MKIKGLNALFILFVIGLFLVGSVAASDFDISGRGRLSQMIMQAVNLLQGPKPKLKML